MRKNWILLLSCFLGVGFVLAITSRSWRLPSQEVKFRDTEVQPRIPKGKLGIRTTSRSPLFHSLDRRRGNRVVKQLPVSPRQSQKKGVSRDISVNKLLSFEGGVLGSRSMTPSVALRPTGVAQLFDGSRPGDTSSSPTENFPLSDGTGSQSDQLAEINQGYNAAQSRLFGGGVGAFGASDTDVDSSDNPFNEAIDDDGAPTDVSGGEDTGDGDSGDGPDNPGENDGDSGDDSGGPVKPPFFNVLITGPVQGPEFGQLHRAWRASPTLFVLEDFRELSFQPGLVPYNQFEDQQLYLGDVDSDGDVDATVVSRIPSIGSVVETFIQVDQYFELSATILTYLKSVRCVEYFDFNGDSENELIMTFEGLPNVHVYEAIEGAWVYQSEIVLSFIPGVLIETTEGAGTAGNILYMLSEDFTFAANILAVRPDIVRFSPQLPQHVRKMMNVQWQGESSSENDNVMVFEMFDKLILIDWSPRRWDWTVSLSGSQFQRTIIGENNISGKRQIFWIP